MRPVSPVSISDFVTGIERLYDPSNPEVTTSRASHRKVKQVLQGIAAMQGLESTSDLTPDVFARYLKSLTCNPNSVRSMMTHLRAAVSHGIELGWLSRNQAPAWRRITPRAVRMTLNQPLTYAQLGLLLNHLQQQAHTWRGRRLYALTYLIAMTGLRRDEALCARVSDIDWESRLLHVVERERKLKTEASARSVALPGELIPVLRDWIPWTADNLDDPAGGIWLFPGVRKVGPWLNGSAQSRALTQLQAGAREAGLGRITWHGLRHSFATIALQEWKKPLWVVSKALGHSSIRTTETYLHLNVPRVLSAEFQDATFRPRA